MCAISNFEDFIFVIVLIMTSEALAQTSMGITGPQYLRHARSTQHTFDSHDDLFMSLTANPLHTELLRFIDSLVLSDAARHSSNRAWQYVSYYSFVKTICKPRCNLEMSGDRLFEDVIRRLVFLRRIMWSAIFDMLLFVFF